MRLCGVYFSILAALLSASSAYGFDGEAAALRMGALLQGAGLPEARTTLSQAVRAPSPAATPVIVSRPALFASGLWDKLAAPSAGALAQLIARDPALPKDQVREITYDALDKIMSAAVSQGLTGLDVFSDAGLKGPHLYYISSETLKKIFKKYELRALTLPEGKDVHGKPFRMDAALAGGGRVVMFYDRGFNFSNPYYTDFNYFSEPRVTYTILADGDLGIAGLRVDADFILHMRPRVTRARKASSSKMFVYTTWGDRYKPLWPIEVHP